MCTSSGEAWHCGTIPRSPSHESVTTELSLFSISSAASDAKMLRLLAARASQGSDSSQRGLSANPETRGKRPSSTLPLWGGSSTGATEDGCRDLLAGCAALCAALGLHRSFSASDALDAMAAAGSNCGDEVDAPKIRSACSELKLSAALEARALGATSRSCSTWVAVGGSQLPSPQRPNASVLTPADLIRTVNKKVRQNYIRRRLLTTYRALERLSQSEFNLDRLEAAAVSAVAHTVAGPGPTTLAVPPAPSSAASITPPAPNTATPPEQPKRHIPCSSIIAGGANLVLTAADLERERGRPLSKYERNMMIFNWLHNLDEADNTAAVV